MKMTVPVRYRVAALLLLGTAVNYLDRVNISVAAPSMMAHTGMQKDQFGLVFSSFLLGYALMQIPAGISCDRGSPKKILVFSFVVLSILTLLTPLAAETFTTLLAVRFLLGACEAVMFPAATAVNVRWFPPKEFARAQMLSASGAPIGQMIAYPMVAWLVMQASWLMAFYVSAAIGFVWVAFWARYAEDKPRVHAPGPGNQLATTSELPRRRWPLRSLLTSTPIILLAASAMCFGFVLWTFLFWLPTYLVEARGLSMQSVGAFGIAVQACGAVGLLTSGVLSDLLLRKTGKAHIARSKFAGGSLLLAVACLLVAVTADSAALTLLFLAAFYLFFMFTPVAFHATPASLIPNQAASVYGVVNTCASLGGVLGPAIVGAFVTRDGGWERSLEIVAFVGLVSASLLMIVPVRRLGFVPDQVVCDPPCC